MLKQKGKIGMFMGKKVIEDNDVEEIRIPSAVIKILNDSEIWVEASEYGESE